MDGVKLAEYLLGDIREQCENAQNRLVDGSIGSMEDYRFLVGQIRGLRYTEDLIRSAMKGTELEDG